MCILVICKEGPIYYYTLSNMETDECYVLICLFSQRHQGRLAMLRWRLAMLRQRTGPITLMSASLLNEWRTVSTYVHMLYMKRLLLHIHTLTNKRQMLHKTSVSIDQRGESITYKDTYLTNEQRTVSNKGGRIIIYTYISNKRQMSIRDICLNREDCVRYIGRVCIYREGMYRQSVHSSFPQEIQQI